MAKTAYRREGLAWLTVGAGSSWWEPWQQEFEAASHRRLLMQWEQPAVNASD